MSTLGSARAEQDAASAPREAHSGLMKSAAWHLADCGPRLVQCSRVSCPWSRPAVQWQAAVVMRAHAVLAVFIRFCVTLPYLLQGTGHQRYGQFRLRLAAKSSSSAWVEAYAKEPGPHSKMQISCLQTNLSMVDQSHHAIRPLLFHPFMVVGGRPGFQGANRGQGQLVARQQLAGAWLLGDALMFPDG